MNDENRQALLAALRTERRDQGGKIRGVMTCECPSTSCPVGEIRVNVHERAGCKILQPKLKCIRCGMELQFLNLT